MYPAHRYLAPAASDSFGDYALYPHGVTYPSGTWAPGWTPGDTSQYGYYSSPNFYTDPQLGDMGGFFDVITAPFKLAVKGVKAVGKHVVVPVIKTIPKAAAGFAVGGVPGLIAAGGSSLIATWSKASPQQKQRIEAAVMERIANTSAYGSGPYGDSTSAAADAVWNAALMRGGDIFAGTTTGKRVIRQQIQQRMAPFLLPAALVVGAIVLTQRRPAPRQRRRRR